ncbi:sigma-70 family RNA polymerase sigma factor [Phycisphaeraceae bacterium D3-23]
MSELATYDLKLMDPAQWVHDHSDALYAYALSRVRRPDVAEDLVQDALVAALESHETFEGRSSERTWLVGILRHKVLDHFRRTRRTREAQDLQVGDAHGTMGLYSKRGRWSPKPADWGGDPAELYENEEFWRVYHACRDRLPTTHAEAYILRELEGLAPQEICKVLDISATNLSVRLHRARLFLRECLESNWFGR